MSKAKLAIALSTLSVVLVAWAVPIKGIAHQRVQQPRVNEPVAPIRLRDESSGLLASGWINGAGPFVFAIDTGAGVSLIRVVLLSHGRSILSLRYKCRRRTAAIRHSTGYWRGAQRTYQRVCVVVVVVVVE